MKKFLIFSCSVVFLCIAILLLPSRVEKKMTIATETKKEEKIDNNNSLTYIVKDFNGNIAVFEGESEKPFKITSVCTNTLPKIDQEQLKKGIKVSTQEELNALLEDLCS